MKYYLLGLSVYMIKDGTVWRYSSAVRNWVRSLRHNSEEDLIFEEAKELTEEEAKEYIK
jgi:hypothetical protein